jgi:hypothetical protein
MRVVIRPHRPVRNAALIGIAAVVSILLLWWLLDFGHWWTIGSRTTVSQQRADLWTLATQKSNDNEKLREQIALAERTAAIDQQTAQEVQELVSELQQQVFELTQEIDFYRGILVASKTEEGLRIQGIRIEQVTRSDLYRYRLVLTHVVKDDRSVKGDVTISLVGGLNGASDGKVVELDVGKAGNSSSIGSAKSTGSGMGFEFKYFQRLQGTFAMPEGFEPESAVVIVREAGKRGSVKSNFSWQEVSN